MFPEQPPHEERGLGGLCEIILTYYINCGYVVGKYELVGYVV